jgi:cobalamin-dependent methionine synthase I
MSKKFTGIGETIHASIPRVAKIMIELHALGEDAFTTDSEPLSIIKGIIEEQADEGAGYIAVNMDAFGEDDIAVSLELMKKYVRLVREFGKGVPVCVDSSDDNVLIAGLKEWYDTDQKVAKPLVNSLKVYTADLLMPLRKEYDYSFVGMLMSEDAPTGPGGSHSVDELFGLAKELFDKAMTYGFTPDDIYFDSTVYPLAIDMPMMPDVPGYTYRAFQTIKKIRNDAAMKDVHFSLGVSNSCRDLPGRKVGVARAYVEVAMGYGLDAGIVNPSHKFGEKPADPELVKLVEAYANLDGNADNVTKAMTLMGQFCQAAKKKQ